MVIEQTLGRDSGNRCSRRNRRRAIRQRAKSLGRTQKALQRLDDRSDPLPLGDDAFVELLNLSIQRRLALVECTELGFHVCRCHEFGLADHV